RMVSSPEYYEVCADAIAEVCEIFGYPRLFHLGLDEENEPNQKFRDMVIIRNQYLWWHDAYFFFSECEKHGARPWVWSDYCWDFKDVFIENMPKSVMQSNWFYREFFDYDPASRQAVYIGTYELLDSLGYDQIPGCSTWATVHNPGQTLAYCKEKLNPALLKGFLTIPWTYTHRESEFTLKNDAHRLYVGRQRHYPETL
ncbi:MAG: hypothetical protein GX633_10515, partial [Clostridiales bacterium]|nr:hypothetical protein [Clostridiales bacterium]